MKNRGFLIFILCTISALLLSLPWLVPHLGPFALIGFVPLLDADEFAFQCKVKGFFWGYFYTFILWNTLTTFWVCNATLGGGIFAIVANALQMCLVWALFRLSKRYFRGPIPYIFLSVMWIAWERRYFAVDISWPWLTLGNAFAGSPECIQWYEYTGSLGGSLWVWLSNLSIFGLLVALSDGLWWRWNGVAKTAFVLGFTLALFGPLALSIVLDNSYKEKSEGEVEVLIAQPNIDPYNKFEALSQGEQTSLLLDLYSTELQKDTSAHLLLLAPETFTSDIFLQDIESSATVRSFRGLMSEYPNCGILFGASAYDFYADKDQAGILSRKFRDGYIVSHNSAVMVSGPSRSEVYHKSKLVVGTESTPYPKFFVPLDDFLSAKLGYGGLIARCVGQQGVSLLHFGSVPIGTAICYESVYGEHCAEYVKAGAQMIAVITNDAWWGNTPGYRQHLNYSRLRAIELRRDVARSANTGISCLIDQRGRIVEQSEWWSQDLLREKVQLSTAQTFFVRYGDIVGRVCTLVFLLLFAFLFVSFFLRRTR